MNELIVVDGGFETRGITDRMDIANSRDENRFDSWKCSVAFVSDRNGTKRSESPLSTSQFHSIRYISPLHSVCVELWA